MQLKPTDNDPWLLNSNKLIYHLERVKQWLNGERVRPIIIDIGATKICQIKCRFCYGIFQKSLVKGEHYVIPPEILVRLFRDAPREGVKALTLTGDGEPTLNPGMFDAIQAGKAGGLDIGVATNGIALNDERIKIMVDSVTWTRVNLSAATRDRYRWIHGADFFTVVMRNVEKLVRQRDRRFTGMTLGLQAVLIPDCLDDIVPLAKIAVDMGVDYFVIKQCSDPEGNLPSSGYDIAEFIKRATPVLKEAEALSTDRTKIVPKWALLQVENKRPYPYCIDLPLIFQISGNSKCYPCGFLFNNPKYQYGDLKQQTLGEILESDHYWHIIDDIMRTHTDELCPLGCCRHDVTNMFMHLYKTDPNKYDEIAKHLPSVQHLNFI